MNHLIRHAEGTGPAPNTTVRRIRGVVTYHNPEKAYGKIHSDGVEYFFHTTACDGKFRDLVEGTSVSFTWAATEKGPRAFDVHERAESTPEEREAHESRGNR